jgi:hypothetical protein
MFLFICRLVIVILVLFICLNRVLFSFALGVICYEIGILIWLRVLKIKEKDRWLFCLILGHLLCNHLPCNIGDLLTYLLHHLRIGLFIKHCCER